MVISKAAEEWNWLDWAKIYTVTIETWQTNTEESNRTHLLACVLSIHKINFNSRPCSLTQRHQNQTKLYPITLLQHLQSIVYFHLTPSSSTICFCMSSLRRLATLAWYGSAWLTITNTTWVESATIRLREILEICRQLRKWDAETQITSHGYGTSRKYIVVI